MITTCQNISAQHRTCIIIIVIEYWSIKVAYRINGELVSPTEGLLNALMLLYADDLGIHIGSGVHGACIDGIRGVDRV